MAEGSKERDGEETETNRARMVEAALRLFARRGYAGCSVQRIADEVGISKQLLLYHFGSKDGIRQAVIARLIELWKEALPRLVEGAMGQEDVLRAGVRQVLQLFEEHPDASRFVLRELIHEDRQLLEQLRAQVHPWMSQMSQLIPGRPQQEGGNRPLAALEVIGVSLMAHFAIFGSMEEDDPHFQRAHQERLRALEEMIVRTLEETLGLRSAPASTG